LDEEEEQTQEGLGLDEEGLGLDEEEQTQEGLGFDEEEETQAPARTCSAASALSPRSSSALSNSV
jgi:hypothetical protein